LDETIFSGRDRVTEYLRVVRRINAGQGAPHHRSPTLLHAVAHIVLPSHRRSDAQNTESGGDCKRDESLPSTHAKILSLLGLHVLTSPRDA
jgi:hypothetical protein